MVDFDGNSYAQCEYCYRLNSSKFSQHLSSSNMSFHYCSHRGSTDPSLTCPSIDKVRRHQKRRVEISSSEHLLHTTYPFTLELALYYP